MKFIAALTTLFASTLAMAATNQFTDEEYKEETAIVKEMVNSTEQAARYNYCTEGTLTCRTLVILKDKATGRPAKAWWDVFVSTERAVGSVGYFLPKSNGKFRAVLDRTLDGEINIDLKFKENQDLEITYDRNGFPTVHRVALKRLGTTRYLFGDMIYGAKEVRLIGHDLDENDPNFREPKTIVYKRQR